MVETMLKVFNPNTHGFLTHGNEIPLFFGRPMNFIRK